MVGRRCPAAKHHGGAAAPPYLMIYPATCGCTASNPISPELIDSLEGLCIMIGISPTRTMNRILPTLAALAATVTFVVAQDWPQWRGLNRDGKVAGFSAPSVWPTALRQAWKVVVGPGESTPALVGDRLYVFARQAAQGTEVIRCLDLATGNEIWSDGYEAVAPTGAPGAHPGPRSSPTVANGKVITLGVQGMVSCLDAASGKVLWRKDDFHHPPQFFTAFSPLVDGNNVILQLGGPANGATPADGAIVAYDLNTGDQKWKWTGDFPHYSSAVLATFAGTKTVVAITHQNVVGLNAADGKQLWQVPIAAGQKNTTPIVDGSTVYAFALGNERAFTVQKEGEQFTTKELWSSTENAVQYNTPVLKNGILYGLSQSGNYFGLNAQDGKTVWTSAPAAAPAAPGGGGGGAGGRRGGGVAVPSSVLQWSMPALCSSASAPRPNWWRFPPATKLTPNSHASRSPTSASLPIPSFPENEWW